ncbi:MAG: chemotaxis protein CheA, partial [Thiothrix sp.]
MDFAPDHQWQTASEPSADSAMPEDKPLLTPDAGVSDAGDNTAEARLIWQLFWEEAPEQLQALDSHLQQLYADPTNLDTLRALERAFHTLKGSARMAQLNDLADIAHHAEDLLEHRNIATALGPADMNALQQAIDRLQQLAETYQQLPAPPAPPPVPASPESATPAVLNAPSAPVEPLVIARKPLPAHESGSLLERLLLEQADSLPDIRILESGSPRSSNTPTDNTLVEPNNNGHETIRVAASFMDSVVEQVVALNRQQVHLAEHFSAMGLDVDELVRTVARLRQQIRALELESEAQIHDGRSQRTTSRATSDGFDPLEMDQYAEIQRISRSLAESLNDLVNLEADLAAQVRKGEQLLQADMQSTRNLQQALLSTRLVAVSVLVPRLRRLTRQVSTELGKQVVLDVQGADCELDRNLLQHLTAPLEHLIRNAIAHGIEAPEERMQSGKVPAGKITLSVQRDDNEIVLTCQDDGRGLNRERLYSKAVEMGLLNAGQTLPEAELDRLILRPGFSTATTVSQIAGRGIGMDVVYSELKALGGNLQIASSTGQGVTFTLRLPFTLVVNPVLLAEVQQQVYALPLNGIQGLARLSGQALQQALQADDPMLEFAGETYTLRYLADALGVTGHDSAWAAAERYPLVFIELQGQRHAWIVDKLRGRREVVLQPLGTLFKNCRLYSAATVAPDGSVFLVPDMAELARQVMQTPPTKQSTPNAAPTAAEISTEPARPTRVMVVDDSVTVRRVTEKFL